MRQYVIKRLLLFIPTVIGVSIVIFTILRVLPGDVALLILQAGNRDTIVNPEDVTRLRQEMGLDRPIHVQYLDWIWGMARGDMGMSSEQQMPVRELLKAQFPVTLQLTLFAITMVICFAIPVGVLAALNQDRWPDYILRGIAIVGAATPGFLVAVLILLTLSRQFGWLPPVGFVNLWDNPWNSARQLIFPAMALAFTGSGTLVRITRAQMLEVVREDYIRTARAKGLVERVIVVRHALRNALIPVITLLGFEFAGLLGGAVIVEQIFALPGIGQQLVHAVFIRDMEVVQAFVLYIIMLGVTASLLIDLGYALLDPRIRYS